MTSIFLLVLGCGTEKEPDERSVSPIGSPFPMDSSDTVVDNPDLIPGNLAGTIELIADVPLFGGTCDSTFELTGTPYTGYCPGCTFNFRVISRETRDGTGECPSADHAWPIFSQATYQLWLWQYKVLFQFSNYWTGTSWYGGSVSNDPAIAWGIEYYPDPYMWPLAYGGGAIGNLVDATDTTLDWTVDWSYYDVYYGTGQNEIHAVGHAYIVQ
jgi:hypothetical protein